MSLQYKEPLHIVRGSGAYLIDQKGKRYLDTVNNVAHVGHEHPRVVRAGQKQMALLNTNSRYLHENITKLTQNLKRRLPPELKVFHFVNSGSEANELALRMVKAVTGSNEMLVSEVGYHGNTNGCVGISSYKFDGKGGVGAPASTHVFPMPNPFRGKYRGSQTAEAYSKEVQILIDKLTIEGKQLGGFIIEPILSCGGQVELPNDFLKLVYPIVRKSGGLCISDEVQTGCGRMGKTFWGFQLHGVTPDIITLGKPLGNGHPVAAVVCTEEVADKFANGMEFFNTFGGNPVSCAIANEVLEVVQDQKLQSNAFEAGNYLKSRLKLLALEHPILGSIRGQGLFLGIELITPEGFPLPVQADYLVNRMKNSGILMSTDGPDHNVIKIKPPLIFSIKNAQYLIKTLSKIMKEDAMQPEFN
jgi:4-aminobutyrate aminotransferase-like enzyme